MKKIAIIIPAYNEQDRISATLHAYYHFFKNLKDEQIADFAILAVLNGCKDNTAYVVADCINVLGNEISIMNLKQAGKGLAIIAGFKQVLSDNYDYIGFVDADMATEPTYFYQLYTSINSYDGVIASRYLPNSKIYPPRPYIKEWGRRLVYNQLVKFLFGLYYADMQCGAKLFKRIVIERIIDQLSDGQWAFDVELLYLAKRAGCTIIEIPTVWCDKQGSKLRTFNAGMKMLKSLFVLKRKHG